MIMKTIILAIDGPSPRSEAARYALGLAQRLKARLKVLQVVSPSALKKRKGLSRMLRKGARILEDTMVTATYAEAGEHELAGRIRTIMAKAAQSMDICEDADERPVDYDVTLTVGDMTEEMVRFVGQHRDAVIAVYDGPTPKGGSPRKRLLDQLSIPMVSLEKNESRMIGK
jgi:nucleotide-binding universal stress UspA family protein